jgi:hypothetical protein
LKEEGRSFKEEIHCCKRRPQHTRGDLLQFWEIT